MAAAREGPVVAHSRPALPLPTPRTYQLPSHIGRSHDMRGGVTARQRQWRREGGSPRRTSNSNPNSWNVTGGDERPRGKEGGAKAQPIPSRRQKMLPKPQTNVKWGETSGTNFYGGVGNLLSECGRSTARAWLRTFSFSAASFFRASPAPRFIQREGRAV